MTVLMVVSCRETTLDKTLRELDVVICQESHYSGAVEEKASEIKVACLSATSDAERWKKMHEVVNLYSSFNLDSMARYIDIEWLYTSSSSEELMSTFDDIYEIALRGNSQRAENSYRAIDTSTLSKKEYIQYLRLGMEIFKHDIKSPAVMENIRKKMLKLDTVSFLGVENKVRFLKKAGQYDKAMDLLFKFISDNPQSDRISDALYNISKIYEKLGERDSCELYMAKSAIEHIRGGRRNFLALYALANYRLEDHDYVRANRYINAHFKIISNGYFYPRIQKSASAASIISSQYIKSQRTLYIAIVSGALIVLIFSIFTTVLLKLNKKRRRDLEKSNYLLIRTQKNLTVANKIKENYVSRYMMLARRYLGLLSEQKNKFKRILSEQGPEELFQELKEVDNDYLSEKEFYRIFDEAFIGLFPDFIHQVNSLIRPEFAFDENTHILPTEIRILAVIRLGITSNADIAYFLNCSLNTVYTYRGKIRNIAVVNRNDIEELISKINT